MINRSVLVVRPREPYRQWALSLDDTGLAPFGEESSAYLIPAFEDAEEARKALSKVYDFVFQEELLAWCTDESTWPKKRTLKMFKEWFDFQQVDQVTDACGYELIDDEL